MAKSKKKKADDDKTESRKKKYKEIHRVPFRIEIMIFYYIKHHRTIGEFKVCFEPEENGCFVFCLLLYTTNVCLAREIQFLQVVSFFFFLFFDLVACFFVVLFF